VIKFFSIAVCSLLFATPALALSKSWTIDSSRSLIEFVALRGSRIGAKGSFKNIAGTIQFDGANLTTASVAAQIPLDRLASGIAVRDDDLKGPKYFNTALYPRASFNSLKVNRNKDGKYVLSGVFGLHGLKKNVDLTLSEPPHIVTKAGKQSLSISATGTIEQSQYGLTLKRLHPDGFVKVNDKIAIKVMITANTVAIKGPAIRLEKTKKNFGAVEEGIELSCNFMVHNDGDKPLRIYETKSTCGCTLASMQKKVIPAGGREALKVVMDTSMKQGPVTKEITVRSNDGRKSALSIFVSADVRNPHQNLGKNVQTKIFQGRCAACHVNRGLGKVGEELYLADCAMCHGLLGGGAVGPSLVRLDYSNKGMAEAVSQIIANGSPSHRSMPGFSKKVGGPLSDSEIESIVKHLQQLSQLESGIVR
jgi:polyisoprenoid-binding protein YceI/cytochrome c553